MSIDTITCIHEYNISMIMRTVDDYDTEEIPHTSATKLCIRQAEQWVFIQQSTSLWTQILPQRSSVPQQKLKSWRSLHFKTKISNYQCQEIWQVLSIAV